MKPNIAPTVIEEAKRHQRIHQRYWILKNPKLSDREKSELLIKWMEEDIQYAKREKQAIEKEIAELEAKKEPKEGNMLLWAILFIMAIFIFYTLF